jgi:trans-aconitate methyltransferase
VYESKGDDQVSWTEPVPEVSLRLLKDAGMTAESCVLDVGGGNSHLVECLVRDGLDCIAVLDVAPTAVERVRQRLGQAASVPTWIIADVTADWTLKPMDIWHDRAVFHFLTDSDSRDRYRQHVSDTVKSGGAAIIATFAPDGPEKCSGLPVARYSPETLSEEFAGLLTLVDSVPHVHVTPWGATQSFQYSRFVKA